MAKYSNNVQNCDHFDLFGSIVNHEQGSQVNQHESRTHNENNVTCDFPLTEYDPDYYIDKLLSVYMLP